MQTIVNDDCLDHMKRMEGDSVTAIVTDPPYALEFMGKGWDKVLPSSETWRECLRVTKPGGILLAFGGTRTYHRLTCSIEDAGWEIRDCLMWMYGSGFPKSLDISKKIDKHGGEQVSWFGPWLKMWRKENKINQKDIAKLFPSKTGGLTGCVANWELGFNMPTNEQFNLICKTFNLPFKNMKEAEREVLRQQKQGKLAVAPGQGADRSAVILDITAPATPSAKLWSGYGTALKPAWEPIVIAMKPLDGTFAANALAHGVAGINVDGCRIAGPGAEAGRKRHGGGIKGAGSSYELPDSHEKMPAGRFPANVILDEEAGALLDEQSGTLKSGKCPNGFRGKYKAQVYGKYARNEIRPETVYGDSGGASRFFYCAKAPKNERLFYCRVCQDVFEATERKEHEHDMKKQDHIVSHPTQKPVALMRYLARLVTMPANGTRILDPFAGSGSTGVACREEGVDFLGIERDPEYVEIARRRIEE